MKGQSRGRGQRAMREISRGLQWPRQTVSSLVSLCAGRRNRRDSHGVLCSRVIGRTAKRAYDPRHAFREPMNASSEIAGIVTRPRHCIPKRSGAVHPCLRRCWESVDPVPDQHSHHRWKVVNVLLHRGFLQGNFRRLKFPASASISSMGQRSPRPGKEHIFSQGPYIPSEASIT